MRLLSLLPACLLATCALAQDPVPGDPAPEYTDGKFFEPNGALFNYDEGSRMNISWVSKYETHNVWLIVGYDYGKPIKVACEFSCINSFDTGHTHVNQWYSKYITELGSVGCPDAVD